MKNPQPQESLLKMLPKNAGRKRWQKYLAAQKLPYKDY